MPLHRSKLKQLTHYLRLLGSFLCCAIFSVAGQAQAQTGTAADPFIDTAQAHLVTTSGLYYFNLGTGTFSAWVDVDEGGGWILVTQYLHKGGTNPTLRLIHPGKDLPPRTTNGLGTDESLGTKTNWGHASLFTMREFTGDLETRWYSITSAHSRVMHFKTTEGSNYIKTGSGNFAGIATNHTLLSGHTANLPASRNNGFTNRGHYAMTDFPFYKSATHHWGIRGLNKRWESDDYPNNSNNHTLHRIWARSNSSDFSDAPQSYGMPTHVIDDPVIRLGASVDAETTDLTGPLANGDGADDDGVTMPIITKGFSQLINVEISQATRGVGYLQGWIDWNGDGDFDDADEQIAKNLRYTTATTGTITVPVRAPANATTNQTYARFRWSTKANLTSTSLAENGEVEDYAFTIQTNPTAVAQCSGAGVNVATSGTASQSSTYSTAVASRMIDGNTSGVWSHGSVAHTGYDYSAWMEVDLGSQQLIDELKFWRRTDCCATRANDFLAFVSATPFPNTGDNDADLQTILNTPSVVKYQHTGTPPTTTTIPINSTGRYIRLQNPFVRQYAHAAEIQALVCPSGELVAEKTVNMWDPSNLGLYSVPGNDVIYDIQVSNESSHAITSDSIFIVDEMPLDMVFYNGDIDDGGPETNPVKFSQSTGAGLTFNYSTDVRYSNSSSRPSQYADCTYTPSAGYDANVKFICFNPKGAMATGNPDPDFTVSFRAKIK